MPKEFSYSIEGLEPRVDIMGGYGFSIYLKKEFAKKAFEKELPEKGYNNLIQMTTGIIVDTGLAKKGEIIRPPVNFFEKEDKNLTCLLKFCTVPGDACDIGANWDQAEILKRDSYYDEYIEYHPHNVDNTRQAYTLLSIWLLWHRIVESFIKT